MGCSSSTTAQEPTQTSSKHDGNNEGTSNENGDLAAENVTLPDLNEDVQSSSAAATHTELEAVSAEADQPKEPESNPPTGGENNEDPAPSENTTEDQAVSSPPEETP
ncbi:hypothetical protein DNTS_025453, partial [Danionella cerebrum]